MADGPPLPDWYDDLAGFERAAWRLVARGAADRRSPMHTPVLATIGLDGSPRGRVLVLRGVDEGARRLRFHSDARADKVAEIGRDPRASVTFYDGGAKLQARMDGTAAVHRPGSPVADAAWEATRAFSRTCYRVEPAAGTALDAGDAYAHPEREDGGRANFVALTLDVASMEVLFLAAAGHRRALFTGGERRWLVP